MLTVFLVVYSTGSIFLKVWRLHGWSVAWRYRMAAIVGGLATAAVLSLAFGALAVIWPIVLLQFAIASWVASWVGNTAARQRERWEADNREL
jgi:uncharacterized membrane protein